jgi:hypothetical protein
MNRDQCSRWGGLPPYVWSGEFEAWLTIQTQGAPSDKTRLQASEREQKCSNSAVQRSSARISSQRSVQLSKKTGHQTVNEGLGS